MGQSTDIISGFVWKLINQLDKRNEDAALKKPSEFNSRLDRIVSEVLVDYINRFNFYPSERKGGCHNLAIFTSLLGDRWDLKKDERLSLEEMFKHLVRHCQGSCDKTTKEVVIITDNWDDDISNFWKHNIDTIKRYGVSVEVHLITGSRSHMFEL